MDNVRTRDSVQLYLIINRNMNPNDALNNKEDIPPNCIMNPCIVHDPRVPKFVPFKYSNSFGDTHVPNNHALFMYVFLFDF